MHRRTSDPPKTLRAAARGEAGLPLADLLYEKMRAERPTARSGNLRNRASVLARFVQEWSLLAAAGAAGTSSRTSKGRYRRMVTSASSSGRAPPLYGAPVDR